MSLCCGDDVAVFNGDAEKVRRDPAVIAAYLGTGVA